MIVGSGVKKSNMDYKVGTCNVPNCVESEYKHHMCKKHYDFYSGNKITARFMEEMEAIEKGTAGWKLKSKLILQSLVHHALNWPMPLIDHYPLEHIFKAEYTSLKNSEDVDEARVKVVMSDFKSVDNEGVLGMKRLLNFRNIYTSELAEKDTYLFTKKDLPSKWPILISVIGFIVLSVFVKWVVEPDFVVMGVGQDQIKAFYNVNIVYLWALALFMTLGLMIPSQYNFFIEKSLKLTLFEKFEDNLDVINQARFVIQRKALSKDYYILIILSSLSSAIWICLFFITNTNSPFNWKVMLLCVALVLIISPLVYSYSEMALFYPVVESLKKKRIAIDLYNADYRGGLKKYHRYLFIVFLYNEGVALSFVKLFELLPFSIIGCIVLSFVLFFRLNHAGWAIISFVRSLRDFYREKNAEQKRLALMKGSIESMTKMEQLRKIHSIGILPVFSYFVGVILIPYVINQLPKWKELLDFLSERFPFV